MFPGIEAGELVDAVVAAEDLGLDEVWIADEGVAREPIPVLAAAAQRTSRIRLGVGVTSPVLRHPGAIAASVSTLDELSSGRATLGLGVGGALSLAPFGLAADRPVRLLRDALGVIRAVHGGTTTAGYEPPPHAAPPRSIPLWVGARGPQLVRVAAQLADGLFLSGCTPAELESIVSNARAAGGTELAVYQTAVDAPTHEKETSWGQAADSLELAVTQYSPGAIGLNLVQLADPGADAVVLVERAAETLRSVSHGASS